MRDQKEYELYVRSPEMRLELARLPKFVLQGRSSRVLESHRWPIFMPERIMEEVCHGTSVQALRERRARQERADARPAALFVQGLRAQLHQHAPARQAVGPEGGGRAALRQRPVHELHRQASGRLDRYRPGLARAV